MLETEVFLILSWTLLLDLSLKETVPLNPLRALGNFVTLSY